MFQKFWVKFVILNQRSSQTQKTCKAVAGQKKRWRKIPNIVIVQKHFLLKNQRISLSQLGTKRPQTDHMERNMRLYMFSKNRTINGRNGRSLMSSLSTDGYRSRVVATCAWRPGERASLFKILPCFCTSWIPHLLWIRHRFAPTRIIHCKDIRYEDILYTSPSIISNVSNMYDTHHTPFLLYYSMH